MNNKTLILIFSFCLIPLNVKAQSQIDSLWILPKKALNTDILKVVAKVTLSSGGARLESSTISINGFEITVKGHYFRNGSTFPSESKDTIFIGKLVDGQYTLIYNLLVPLSGALDRDTIQFTVGVNNVINQNTPKLKIYPNPNHGLFTLSLPDKDKYTIEVFDYLGQKVVNTQLVGDLEYTLNLNLAKGLYYLNSKSSNGLIISEPFIIE